MTFLAGLSKQRRRSLALGLLFVWVVVLYLPALNGGFIWDDDAHLTKNPCVVEPWGVKDIWTTSAARICPLTLSSFWLQHKLWGLNPFPYHLVNVLLHAGSAVLLSLILRRLKVPGAWFAALLWAVHPIQVETVAWITELKNTQSGFFFMLAIWYFIDWSDHDRVSPSRGEWRYGLAVVFSVFAMTSKSSTVVLPVLLGLFLYWKRGHLHSRDGLRLLPFFVAALLTSGLSVWTQRLEGANDPEWERSWLEKTLTAGDTVWFYIGKIVWPQPLVFIYPRWETNPAAVTSYLGALAVALLMVVAWRHRNGRLRWLFFALSYFLAALLPVMGLVDHFFLRYSFVGDHFQYLAGIGFFAFLTGYVAYYGARFERIGRWLGPTIGCIASVALSYQTWNYQAVFADRNPERLWRDVLSKNDAAWLAHNNLGVELSAQGNFTESLRHYHEALRLNPRYASAHSNLAAIYSAQGAHAEAMTHATEAVRLNPNHAEAQYNLGNALMQQRRFAEAVEHYTKALSLKPEYAEAHNNLGGAYASLGDLRKSMEHFRESLRLNPDNVGAQTNLQIIRQALGGEQE